MNRRAIYKWIREQYPLLLGGVFVSSFLVSCLGHWHGLPSWEEISIAGLRAISHFTLNSLTENVENQQLDILVHVGRWLAVLFVVLTTASLLQAIFQWGDRVFRWWHCRGKNTHDIIIGCGWKGMNFIRNRNLEKNSKVCFLIEHTPNIQNKRTAWDEGLSLVQGDGLEVAVLKQVRPDKARAIYICTGKDDTNIQIVQEIARLNLLASAIICVDLQSQRRFDILKKSIPSESLIDLRLFNTEAITTRLLLEKYPMDRFQSSSVSAGAEIILMGESSMARELVRQVMQHGIFEPEKKLAIKWFVEEPRTACKCFSGFYPCFTAEEQQGQWVAKSEKVWSYDFGAEVLPDIHFLALPLSGRGVFEIFESSDVLKMGNWNTSVYIVFDDAARSAALASLLAPFLQTLRPERDVSLFFYYNTHENRYRKDIEASLNSEFPLLPTVAFSDFLGNCSMESVRGDFLDRLARRVNGIYKMEDFQNWLKSDPQTKKHPEWEIEADTMRLDRLIHLEFEHSDSLHLLYAFETFCLEKWPECTESDKESNRQAGSHALVKKRIRERISLTDAQLEQTMAEIEHRRWCVEYLLKGFRPLTRIPSSLPLNCFQLNVEETDAINSWFGLYGKTKTKALQKSLKRHVDLIPFADFRILFQQPNLAEKEETKDRDQIRALDLILRTDLETIYQ